MLKILFLCHGNICRSPMAEYIMKHLAVQAHRSEDFLVSSAAVSCEEIGCDIYPPAKRELTRRGIAYSAHKAHRVTDEEMQANDYVLVMDSQNMDYLHRLFGRRYDDKVHMLLEYAGESRDVSDPWYCGNFDKCYDDIYRGCEGLIRSL